MDYYLYSHNDLDGVGCGILAKIAFGEKIKIKYNSISSLNHELELYFDQKRYQDVLYITDLGINEENEKRIEQYIKKGGTVQLIDHHKSSLHLGKYPWAIVKIQENEQKLSSATSLFFHYIVENNLLNETKGIKEFVELVRLYDTWEWDKLKVQAAKNLNDLLYLDSIEEFEKKIVAKLQEESEFSFSELEEHVLHIEEKKTERYIHKKKREVWQTFVKDHCIGIVFAEQYQSELGNGLGEEFPHLDYIAIVNMSSRRVGFRTIHDHVDLAEVAHMYGGGGHAKAAGCQLTKEAYQAFVESTLETVPIKQDHQNNKQNGVEKEKGILFENKEEEMFLIKKLNDKWEIKCKGKKILESFLSEVKAIDFLRRKYQVFLSSDEKYQSYLKKN
ncbi:DHH family phosphoesterase [Metabacillus arenae]|uniref:Oligoribonuclease n=1 Tax=Metabacillus arenae TaxID=2771434 RepID=A0A926ND11_9BACI|nr:DHH family phosphoesterase [Metabacillus arenae]MBD1378971.1 oligoribonuclease [Metabacillus arenae]